MRHCTKWQLNLSRHFVKINPHYRPTNRQYQLFCASQFLHMCTVHTNIRIIMEGVGVMYSDRINADDLTVHSSRGISLAHWYSSTLSHFTFYNQSFADTTTESQIQTGTVDKPKVVIFVSTH